MKMLKMATKGLAGVALAALLAVNVQIGSGNGFLATNYFHVNKAHAWWCEPVRSICTVDIFANVIWGNLETGLPPKQKKLQRK